MSKNNYFEEVPQKDELSFFCCLPNPANPPELCFTCGNNLPINDFDLYHTLVKKKVDTGMKKEIALKIVLDSELSKVYQRRCCRAMFIGDAIEYRTYMKMYDFNQINSDVDFS